LAVRHAMREQIAADPATTTNGHREALLADLQPIDRDVREFLGEVDRRLVPFMKRALSLVPGVEPLRRGMTHQVLSGGKRIRAALCVASCELFGVSYLRALNFAAAVEHMQNFTLVHDDIADGDTHRRAQESIWKQFGVPHGINIGDMFVPLVAFSILQAPYSDRVKLLLFQTVSEFGLEMAVGQALDINLRANDSPTVDEYLACTRRKTGAFLAIATVGGAIIGGAKDAQQRLLRDFAMLAGTGFQIKDDIIDLDGFKGRQRGSDIMEGKRTLLVIHAARNISPLQRRRLFAILNKPRDLNSADDLEWVFDLYRRTGAAEYAQLTAIRLVDQAVERVGELPETPAKYRLLRLANYLSRRSH